MKIVLFMNQIYEKKNMFAFNTEGQVESSQNTTKMLYFLSIFYQSSNKLIHIIKGHKLQSMHISDLQNPQIQSPPPFSPYSYSQHSYSPNYHSKIFQEELSQTNQRKKIICALLKTSDQYGLSKTTKYLAREYCVRFLKEFPAFLFDHTELLMITCLRVAVKFNQNEEISSSYSIECCVSQSQGKYLPENFIEFEVKLLNCLKYNLYIKSPYDILQENAQFLCLKETEKVLVETAIDYALSLVELLECRGLQIYGYCLVAISEERKMYNWRVFMSLQRMFRVIPNLQAQGEWIRQAIFGMEEETNANEAEIY